MKQMNLSLSGKMIGLVLLAEAVLGLSIFGLVYYFLSTIYDKVDSEVI